MKLTEWTSCGGCAAKWGGAPLTALVGDLAGPADPDLLLGLAPFDDAAVYRLGPDTALVSTTDFFPPLVDDPADFGAIAAANACSDVFAMGGRVVMALNIAAFPEDFPPEAIADDLRGRRRGRRRRGRDRGRRAHHPLRRADLRAGGPGARPPGPGVDQGGGPTGRPAGAFEADRVGHRPGGRVNQATRPRPSPSCGPSTPAPPTLHDWRRTAGDSPVHAVTDVTGFGLAGHGWEMAERSGVTVRFHAGGRSRSIRAPWRRPRPASAPAATPATGRTSPAVWRGEVPTALDALAVDPQTSGGLLAAVTPTTTRRSAPRAGGRWARSSTEARRGARVWGRACAGDRPRRGDRSARRGSGGEGRARPARLAGGGVRAPGGLRRLQSGWLWRPHSGGFDSRPPPPSSPPPPVTAFWREFGPKPGVPRALLARPTVQVGTMHQKAWESPETGTVRASKRYGPSAARPASGRVSEECRRPHERTYPSMVGTALLRLGPRLPRGSLLPGYGKAGSGRQISGQGSEPHRSARLRTDLGLGDQGGEQLLEGGVGQRPHLVVAAILDGVVDEYRCGRKAESRRLGLGRP